MIETTLKWYTPEEKTPENGEVIAINAWKHAIMVSDMQVYNGHFNCTSDDTEMEIFPTYWAYIPKDIKRANK